MFSQDSYFQHKFNQLQAEDTSIKSIQFEQCKFNNCFFTSVIFDSCQFIDCTFTNCSFSAIKPDQSTFTDATFKDSKVISFDWTKSGDISGLIFNECDISFSNFAGTQIPKTKIINCRAHEVNFVETDLHESKFTGTDFTQAVFHHTNLEKCNFEDASNYSIDIRTNKTKAAKFNLPQAINLLRCLDIKLE